MRTRVHTMSADPFYQLDGAVVRDAAVLHYGSPLAEQRELAHGNAVVSLAHHEIVTVAGEDRLTWLHAMTSQHLSNLAPNESTETLLLDAQGRIEHAIRLVDDGEHSWLLLDPGSAAPLTEYLQRMRFAKRVEVRNVSADYAAVLVFDGGAALPALRAQHIAVAAWRDPWATTMPGGAQYASTEHAGAGWAAVQLIVPRQQLVDIVRLLTPESVLRPAGTLAFDALEIRAWRPSMRGEADARAIPHELDWLRTAVHLNKGCYRGQETVAKVHNLGHPPRRLTLLHLDGAAGELPAPGAAIYQPSVTSNARPIGQVTRAAQHYEWGGIALALLKRTVPEAAALEVALNTPQARVAATQEIIVPIDAGRTRTIPKLKRL